MYTSMYTCIQCIHLHLVYILPTCYIHMYILVYMSLLVEIFISIGSNYHVKLVRVYYWINHSSLIKNLCVVLSLNIVKRSFTWLNCGIWQYSWLLFILIFIIIIFVWFFLLLECAGKQAHLPPNLLLLQCCCRHCQQLQKLHNSTWQVSFKLLHSIIRLRSKNYFVNLPHIFSGSFIGLKSPSPSLFVYVTAIPFHQKYR